MGVLALIILLRLGWEYRSWQDFVSRPLFYTHAVILATYPPTQKGRKATVLKLRTEAGRTIYTTAWRKGLVRGERLYLQLLPGPRIGFWDYLGGMYCKSRIKRTQPPERTLRTRLGEWIADQHADGRLADLYRGLFLAEPIPRSLRMPIAGLGVSHLVALSGFHLGILWGVLYGVLLMIYRPFQQRFFPYRYALRDVGGAVMLLLGGYLWLTGSPPSLLRAYAMLLAGWGLVLMGIELVSFPFLMTVGMVLLALFPPLIVSLGFGLSMAGVFYVFLLLRYCQHLDTWRVSLVCIPVGIFLLMQPIVHGVFGVTTPWQLLSPLLSILFVLFYPLAFVLHLIGQGGMLDGSLADLFTLVGESHEHLLPWWGMIGYIGLSLLAVWRRWGFYLLLGGAAAYAGYLYLW